MIYSIWPNPLALVDSARKKPDFQKVFDSYKSKHNLNGRQYNLLECAAREWENLTSSTSSFSGKHGTRGVIKDFEGPHEYEAQIISNIEAEIISDEFFKKRFVFVNRQIVGQMVDIPRYLNGDMRYWFATKRMRRTSKAVRVFAPMGGTYEVSKEQMQVCGALTCAITEMLEANGINVELWASCCAEGVFNTTEFANNREENMSHICQLIKIKDSSEYCDYGMINYITGNSQFYRNIVFKDRINAGVNALESGREMYYFGVGGSYNFDKRHIPIDEDYDAELDIVIPRIYNIDQAKQYIESHFIGDNTYISKIITSPTEE